MTGIRYASIIRLFINQLIAIFLAISFLFKFNYLIDII